MSSKFVLKSLLFLTIISLFSCLKERVIGSGNISSQTLNLNPFTEIEIQNYCNVDIVVGSENKVEYSDHENIIQYLKFEIVGNKLVIKTTDNVEVSNSKAQAKVYVLGNLNKIFISGSGNINLKSSFTGLNQCSISGSGNINAEVNTTPTSPDISCSISGSGNIDLLKISSLTANCVVSGSGNISVAVANTLNATISGSGNIQYLGNPVVVSSITGSGNVVKL